MLLILAGSWLYTDGRLPPGLAAVATRVGRRLASGTAGPTVSAFNVPLEDAEVVAEPVPQELAIRPAA